VSQHYKNRQLGYLLLGIVVLMLTISMAIIYSLGSMGSLIGDAVIPIVTVVVVMLIASFATLTVEVDQENVQLYFGPGVIKKTIPISAIRFHKPVRNKWYYGFGIRYYPGGTLWNVSGLHAIELTLRDGKRFRIGTDEPQALSEALSKQTGELAALTEEELQQSETAGRKGLFIVAGFVLLIFLGVAGLFYGFMQPAVVELGQNQLKVSGLFYTFAVDTNEIDHLTLQQEKPRIKIRTNGFAAFGVLRGHFRVVGLGVGMVFINHNKPPYILVRTKKQGFVIVNFEDPEDSKELFEKLKKLAPGAPPSGNQKK
jgi:hypothetical protein